MNGKKLRLLLILLRCSQISDLLRKKSCKKTVHIHTHLTHAKVCTNTQRKQ